MISKPTNVPADLQRKPEPLPLTDRREITLDRCPFCGSEKASLRGTYAAYVVCLDCGASTDLCENFETAAQKWNRRYYDKPV